MKVIYATHVGRYGKYSPRKLGKWITLDSAMPDRTVLRNDSLKHNYCSKADGHVLS